MTDLLNMLNEIEEKAKKATPGPYMVADRERVDNGDWDSLAVDFSRENGLWHRAAVWVNTQPDDRQDADASYIAQCSPANMLALCAQVRALMAENERLRNVLTPVVELAIKNSNEADND